LKDTKGLLEGGAVMRHLKITAAEAVDEKLIADLVRQAVALNRAKGDPTARSQSKKRERQQRDTAVIRAGAIEHAAPRVSGHK
jgi:hypothetical protein